MCWGGAVEGAVVFILSAWDRISTRDTGAHKHMWNVTSVLADSCLIPAGSTRA